MPKPIFVSLHSTNLLPWPKFFSSLCQSLESIYGHNFAVFQSSFANKIDLQCHLEEPTPPNPMGLKRFIRILIRFSKHILSFLAVNMPSLMSLFALLLLLTALMGCQGIPVIPAAKSKVKRFESLPLKPRVASHQDNDFGYHMNNLACKLGNALATICNLGGKGSGEKRRLKAYNGRRTSVE